jgi:hypothetical protein
MVCAGRRTVRDQLVEEGSWRTTMRSVVAAEYPTIDGVMQDPGGVGEFEHGGWSNPYFDDELAEYQSDQLFGSDALLLGRQTFRWLRRGLALEGGGRGRLRTHLQMPIGGLRADSRSDKRGPMDQRSLPGSERTLWPRELASSEG